MAFVTHEHDGIDALTAFSDAKSSYQMLQRDPADRQIELPRDLQHFISHSLCRPAAAVCGGFELMAARRIFEANQEKHWLLAAASAFEFRTSDMM